MATTTRAGDIEDKQQSPRDSSPLTSRRRKLSHRYRGHRAASFTPDDVNELVEIRARQRTFNGAYARTALVNLGYSVTVLKLFDRRFYRIGLLYAILAGVLFVLSYLRSRHSRHDFADYYREMNRLGGDVQPVKTVGQTGKRIFGRPFVTAGWIALSVSLIVLSVEIGLLVLILKLCKPKDIFFDSFGTKRLINIL